MEAMLSRYRHPGSLSVPKGSTFEAFIGARLIGRCLVSVRKIRYADGQSSWNVFYHDSPQAAKRRLLLRLTATADAHRSLEGSMDSSLQHAIGHAFLRLYCPTLLFARDDEELGAQVGDDGRADQTRQPEGEVALV